jgi:hypothetical protein
MERAFAVQRTPFFLTIKHISSNIYISTQFFSEILRGEIDSITEY